jgi:phosphomevalonate kinase
MIIIGLSGKKLSGKDTVYELAADICDKSTRIGRVAFADPLKQEVSEITGMTCKFIEENKSDFRELLQVWGTEFRRRFNGNDYWINKMGKIIEQSEGYLDMLFITDIRFKNEADYIKAVGGKLVRVERRQYDYDSYPGPIDTHSTEKDMDDYSQFDYVLNNDKTIDELANSVRDMLGVLKITRNAA